FMEMKGEFALKPTEKTQEIQPCVTLLSNQDEEDVENNDDFVDVQSTIATQPPQQQQLPMQSKLQSRKSPQKQMETEKRQKRPTKRKRCTKDETEDLINELKNALSQHEKTEQKETATPEISLMNDFSSDDDTHVIKAAQMTHSLIAQSEKTEIKSNKKLTRSCDSVPLKQQNRLNIVQHLLQHLTDISSLQLVSISTPTQ
ncbi:unnamed protein product, partial [Didymodactylos carnosus]